ncbi:MAG: hypothetical protein ACRDX8_11525, partial [Acidimicrobiales bacterium]
MTAGTTPATAPTAPNPPAAHQVVTDPLPLTSPSQITACHQGVYTYVDSAGQTVMGFAGSFSCPKVPTPTPSTNSPGPVAAPPPSAVAATVWEQDGANQLPSPHPYIAPGYALAGLRGYLEVRAPLTAAFSDPTRLGTLTIAATAKLWVDWGDGDSNDGPYDSAGGAYPNGTITHYWDYD